MGLVGYSEEVVTQRHFPLNLHSSDPALIHPLADKLEMQCLEGFQECGNSIYPAKAFNELLSQIAHFYYK